MSQSLYSLYPGSWPLVAESRVMSSVKEEVMDELWAVGWRHFGDDFFRASLMADEMSLKRQIALRINIDEFQFSRSQRRTLHRNDDVEVSIGPAQPGEEEEALFQTHKQRFVRNIPDRLRDFLGDRPDGKPCACLQVTVRQGGRLVAASFLARGRWSCSSIYAVYDPACAKRRLGIFTMLCELRHAREQGYQYYYSGYATIEPSCYDYKRQFAALEYYDWEGRWLPIEERRG